jgi:hypothetical protein
MGNDDFAGVLCNGSGKSLCVSKNNQHRLTVISILYQY